MKEQSGMEKKHKRMTKEKRFYLITGLSSAAALVAVVLTAVLVANFGEEETPTIGGSSDVLNSSVAGDIGGDVGGDIGGETPGEPVITTPEGMCMPVESVSVLHEFGFYHNVTLNNYYEHTGMDFTAAVGTEVFSVDDGVVESIYRDDVLTGTEIVIDHGDGVKTLYRFVDAADNVSVGTNVKRGDVIATVAEASGEEYKDGAHLHFEIVKDGKQVDPSTYLTFDEK